MAKIRNKIIVGVIVSVISSLLLASISALFVKPNICFHKWDEGTVVVEPMCGQDGRILYTCTKCGKERGKIVMADKHIDETGDGVCDSCDMLFTEFGRYDIGAYFSWVEEEEELSFFVAGTWHRLYAVEDGVSGLKFCKETGDLSYNVVYDGEEVYIDYGIKTEPLPSQFYVKYADDMRYVDVYTPKEYSWEYELVGETVCNLEISERTQAWIIGSVNVLVFDGDGVWTPSY